MTQLKGRALLKSSSLEGRRRAGQSKDGVLCVASAFRSHLGAYHKRACLFYTR